jgi:large subunit ribosomal protein LX
MAEHKTKAFEVSGEYEEKGARKRFRSIIKSLNEKTAAEKTMATLGSKHRIKRRNIYLNEIKEWKSEK